MLCSNRRLLRDWEGPLSSRSRTGSIAQDNRSKVWNFFWRENGKRKCKTLGRFPTKAAAWKAAKPLRDALENAQQLSTGVPTVDTLVKQYRAEKMPTRHDTRAGYESWLRVFVLPKWGECPITDLQARPVELWLDSLALAPKSKAHIRGIISALWNYAMWKQDIPMQVNPISLVTIKGASKRVRQPRILTVEQFRLLVSHLREPFNTLALMCVCFGLRISEALALKWADVDWLNGTLRVERGIVQQIVDDVKTDDSRKTLTIADDLLRVLKDWKQTTQFSAPEDWIFASPFQVGRLPLSYTGVKKEIQRAATAAGLGHLRTHTFRHTYRTWLDSVGTPVGVQQKLMRHADIRTTMNIYGDAVTPDMREAHTKIVGLALNGMGNGMDPDVSN
jgi:integrase